MKQSKWMKPYQDKLSKDGRILYLDNLSSLNSIDTFGLPSKRLTEWDSAVLSEKVCCQQRSRGRLKKTSRYSCFLGVETLAELVWEDWEVGKEYTKALILKNVNEKLQKISFRSPVSDVFTTLLPQTIILSPGTSFSLPVTFHPIQKCELLDSIEFQCKDGTFIVNLRAVMLDYELELPYSMWLPLCAVQHTTNTSFILRNTSKLQTCFQWTVDPPFELFPLTGVLEPGEPCRVSVTFKPEEARVYEREALCSFGTEGENSCTMLLKGLSKYPCLQFRSLGQEEGNKLLDFGNVAFGSCLEKHFELYNPSSVLTSFSLTLMKRPVLMESVFKCDIQEGQVAPCSVLIVSVCFTPLTMDSTSVDYFCLSCLGRTSTDVLKVTGSCIGPVVSLSSTVVDFGCVEEGNEAVRTIRITNSSTVQAHYQFDMDLGNHSVFRLNKTAGILPAKGRLTLCLKFCPHHPIAYHKRTACLILQREPLLLDLIGTCHSEQLKPDILQPRHLHVYRTNLLRGLTCYPPDVLSAMLADHKLRLDENGALLFQKDASEDAAFSRSPFSQRSVTEEYFHLNLADKVREQPEESGVTDCFSLPHVTLEPTELLLNLGASSKSVTITNHTKGNLSLLWTPAADSPFSITPLTIDLSPLKSTVFIVTYAPKQHNGFSAAQLECFCLYKILRDHQQMDNQTLCPPWCLTVRVTAHSFQLGNEHFIPSFTIQPTQVMFPALNQVSYRSILLQNIGNFPLIFRSTTKDCPDVSVLPSVGLVPPGSHQIFTFRSTPAEDNPGSLPLTLHFNTNPKYTQELSMVCVAEKPQIILEGDGDLLFNPTTVGSCSKKTVRIRNFSRVALHFHWNICSSDNRVLSVQPDSGVLQPNQSQVQTWSFTPLEEMEYNMIPTLVFWPIEKPDFKISRLHIEAVGLSVKGSIQTDCSFLDLGEVLVGSCKSFDVCLLNPSPCAISFSLTVMQNIIAPGIPEDSSEYPLVLDMESMKGTIQAQGQLAIHSTVSPTRMARYCWTISYKIVNDSVTTNSLVVSNQDSCSLCQIEAKGIYPTLKVTDVKGRGSVQGLSKVHLWELFSLDTLNTLLLSEPAPPELTYRVPTRHSFNRCPPILTSAIMDFNFNSAPHGADPATIQLVFENTGNILVEWSFLFPDDQQIELECWAENVEFSPIELFQMKIQDNRIFSVSPRSGKLQPGQQRAVQFTYRHDFIGTYQLPVLLKLSHGREILLNFIGVTVEKYRCYLHFHSTRHVFTPVAIGGYNPPRQVYELYNGGSQPVKYYMDTLPLRELQEENFNHPVLQCLNPEGEVQPGCITTLQWIFFPLEAKAYSVDIPIYVLDGDTVLITFEGYGFDTRDSVPLQLRDRHFNVPCTQKGLLPGQMVLLSEERVSFDDIPVGSRNTRILFLTNVSHTDRVLYSWKLKEQDDNKAVQIHPASGSLSAKESVSCILSLCTSSSPIFYQQDLICEITSEATLASYHEELRQWEEKKERAKHEFIITEKDLIQEGTRAKQKSSSGILKFKVLPPIRSSSDAALGEPTADTEKKTKEKVEVNRPVPPRPQLLHLGITARSHSLQDFQAQFPSQLTKHHISSSLLSEHTLSESAESMPFPSNMPVLAHGPERDILTHTLTSLLRCLLDDPDFHQQLQNIPTEPTPYFTQFRPASPVLPISPTATQCTEDTDSRSTSNYMEYTDAVIHTHTQSESQRGPQSYQGLNPKLREHVQESICRSAEIGDLMEEILLNTLQNIMAEAFLGELVLTAQPPLNSSSLSSARRTSSGQSKDNLARESDQDQSLPD